MDMDMEYDLSKNKKRPRQPHEDSLEKEKPKPDADSPPVCMDAIYCEDEDEDEKLVYLFILNRRTGVLVKVVTFDPHQEEVVEAEGKDTDLSPSKGFVDVTSMVLDYMPYEIREVRYPNIQVLGSKLYFIGGINPNGMSPRESEIVFAFDTRSTMWFEVASTNTGRLGSAIVTYDDRIYVFGSLYPSTPPIPEHWAEVYDAIFNTWDYLEGGVAPQALRECGSNTIAVVSKHSKTIFLCKRYFDVYAYSLDRKCWLVCITQPAFTGRDTCTFWNDTVAVVDDTLFWECFGIIQAFHIEPLSESPVAVAKHHVNLPGSTKLFGTSLETRKATFLVNAGNGKLVLCYGCWDEAIVCCHTFEVTRFAAEKRSRFQLKDVQDSYGGPDYFIIAANVM